MRFSRISKVLGVAAVSALALSACASTGGDSNGSGNSTKSITVAETNTFSSLNSDSAEGNSDINGKIALLTHGSFQKITDDLKVEKNEDFGKIEVESQDPLKVKYTIKDDAEWSDGNKIDEGDMLLEWAAASGKYGTKDDQAFAYGGDTSGLGLTSTPEFSEDGRTMTLTYSKPFVDYQTAFDLGNSGSFALPAHIVAKKAGMSEDELVTALKEAKQGQAADAKIKKIAEVWNNAYNTTTMPSDSDLLVSSGPYKIKDIQENQSVTLEKNDKYKGEAPKIDEITVKTLGDANAQVQALNNGEVDVVAPQSSVDTIQQIKDASGVKSVQGDQLAYDHLDLNFGSDVFKDENTRKAFLLSIPREAIVNKLIKPMKDDASVLDSQVFVNSQKPYADAVKDNGSDQFPSSDMDANISKAKELLGGKTPTVKILYNSGNPIRVNAFQMIQESAAKAGFKVTDGGSASWSKELSGGNYDASLFGWVSPGVGHAMYGQIFKTGGGGNYNKYSNSDVDSKVEEINGTVDDESKVNELGAGIDKDLFGESYGLPLFQTPGIVGMKDRVSGIDSYNPTQTGVFWNVEKWDVSS